MKKPENTNSLQRDTLLLFLLIFCFFIIGIGVNPYITPSEARYIEIPRQMLASGDWLTPHINGVQYFEKPPLFYWMQAIFLGIGYSEFWGRAATVLAVTLTCVITYKTARLLYGMTSGLLGAAALATSVMGYGLSRVSMLDAPVTLFLTAAIASFIFAQKTEQKKYYYFMYASAALAVMTKGLIGIVIPGLVIGGWILFTNNWRILKSVRLFSGTLLFLAIVAPWHIAMQMKHPEFFDFYFIHEHFTRFLTNEHKRTAPWWFFIAVTFAGMLPWAILVIGHESWVRKRDNYSLFISLWILLPLLFFSSSHSKLVPYIFPIFPPLFILIGNQLEKWWELPTAPKALRVNALFCVSLIAGAAIAAGFFGKKLKIPEIGFYDFLPLIIVSCALFIAAVIKKTPAKTIIAWTIVFGATLGLTANYNAGSFNKRTIKPLAEILIPTLQDVDMVVAYNSYWQDLPVYLTRNVTVAGWSGELGFGLEHTPNAKQWMITIPEFWEKCAEEKNNVYVFMNEGDFSNIPIHDGCLLREISRYGKTILLKKDKN